MTKLRRIGAVAGAAALLWGTSACSGDSEAPASGTTSASSAEPDAATSDDRGSAPPDADSDGGGTADPAADASDDSDGKSESESGESGKPGATRAQTAVLRNLPGRQDGGCVSVDGHRDVRSGGMGAGPFDEARATFRTQQREGQPATVRLYFIPATGQRPLPGLSLRIRDLATGEETEVEETTTSDADRWAFYDTQVPVPAAGRYEIRATSGADSGCFLVRFGRAG